jgi:hypothetical protein
LNIHKEYTLPDVLEGYRTRKLISDIHFNKPTGGTVDIDVTIRNPSAASAIQKGSFKTPLQAAIMGEQEKRTLYHSVYSNHHPSIVNGFIPFSIETTGALGPKASDFISDICKTRNRDAADSSLAKHRNKFFKEAASILASERAIQIKYFYAQLREIQPHAIPWSKEDIEKNQDKEIDDDLNLEDELSHVSLEAGLNQLS